eukprot:4127392-Pyramimonas_sp.AAC.1
MRTAPRGRSVELPMGPRHAVQGGGTACGLRHGDLGRSSLCACELCHRDLRLSSDGHETCE